MFIAGMSTIAKLWKEPQCPSKDEWIKMWSRYTMEYYSAIRSNEYWDPWVAQRLLAPAFGPGWDPGVPGSSPTLGSLHVACFFLCLCLCLSLSLSLSVCVCVCVSHAKINKIFFKKRNNKYPPVASTWMELEGIMLSEVSQLEKDKHYMI